MTNTLITETVLCTTAKYAYWKGQCKKIAAQHFATAEFYGDKDIGGCKFMVGNVQTLSFCAEWDGETGTVIHFA
jgi:hypothetical protein